MTGAQEQAIRQAALELGDIADRLGNEPAAATALRRIQLAIQQALLRLT